MDYDIIVIGGGPGGYTAAIHGARKGARVAVVEGDRVGGTCLNRGCIPTKSMLATAALWTDLEEKAADMGIRLNSISLDYPRVLARKAEVVNKLSRGIEFLFKRHHVNLISGKARLKSPTQVEVTDVNGRISLFGTKNVIIASGSAPALPDLMGYNGRNIISSNELLDLENIPERLLVIGGGVIGCEFATLFSCFGVKVTVVEAMPQILPMVDQDVARRQQALFKRKGIRLVTGASIVSVIDQGKKVSATLASGEEIGAELALIAVGRTFPTAGLGLEGLGLTVGPRGEIVVDDYMRTSVSGIYAVGDVTNKILLAHVASAQGIIAAENINGSTRQMDYRVVPNCIYTIPEMGSVGMTTQQAEAAGLTVKTEKYFFTANGKAVCAGETDGMIKIIIHQNSGEIAGVHILGPHATELIAEAALAMQLGATASQVARTIHAHPTLAEVFMEAAGAVQGMGAG
ncbi:MAG: dihydrolipoyl dehydrogenase [Bacillota bacterium]